MGLRGWYYMLALQNVSVRFGFVGSLGLAKWIQWFVFGLLVTISSISIPTAVGLQP